MNLFQTQYSSLLRVSRFRLWRWRSLQFLFLHGRHFFFFHHFLSERIDRRLLKLLGCFRLEVANLSWAHVCDLKQCASWFNLFLVHYKLAIFSYQTWRTPIHDPIELISHWIITFICRRFLNHFLILLPILQRSQ